MREGRVRINGEICTALATTVSSTDRVEVDGRKALPHPPLVIALHKPKGYVCTREDERHRRTIYDLLPPEHATLHHVGRLDLDSSGLILLTNQGELSQSLLHPSKGAEKEYEVTLEEPFQPDKLERLIKGFHTEEGIAKAERAWMIGDYKIGLVLKQGFKRQIRNMLYFLGYEVRRLVRVRIGNLSLRGLPEGAWKEIKQADVENLLLHPAAKDRPRLSKPSTASARKRSTLRAEREKKGRSSVKPRGTRHGGSRTGYR